MENRFLPNSDVSVWRSQFIIIFVFIQVFGIDAIRSQQPTSHSQPRADLYDVHMVSPMSTSGADFVLFANAEGIMLATKGRKRDFGYQTMPGFMRPTFRLFQVFDTVGRRYSVNGKMAKSAFGSSIVDIGLAKKGSQLLQVEMSPLSKDRRNSYAIIEIPKIVANDKENSQQAELLTQTVNESEAWSYFHPAIHPNGKIIVFSANCQPNHNRFEPDGTGGYDLFYSLLVNDAWTKPSKFDTLINSPGGDIFPSFSASGKLYFSSNSNRGKNDYDIFCASLFEDAMLAGDKGKWWDSKKKLGSPINTNMDELAMVWLSDHETKAQKGYFSRGKPGQFESCDVYFFQVRKTMAHGSVISHEGNKRIFDILVVSQNGDSSLFKTDLEGQFEIPLSLGQTFRVKVQGDGFKEVPFRTISTIGLDQGEDLEVGDFFLFPNSRVIVGQVLNRRKESLLANTEIQFHSEDANAEKPELEVNLENFIVRTSKNLDFYIDVETNFYYQNSWHYHPGYFQEKDTFDLAIFVDDSVSNIRRMNIAYEGTSNVPGVLIAKLLIYDDTTHSPFELAHDFDLYNDKDIRIAIPALQTRRCSLVVWQKNCLPKVIDPSKVGIPDTIWLRPLSLGSDSIVIYHGYDQKEPDFLLSANELESISQYMMMDEKANIEIVAHTDCRGSSAYNQKLSEDRAKEVRAFIVKRTKAAYEKRITIIGKGESQPQVNCANCSKACPDEVHQKNRRTVIKLVGL